MPKNITHGWTTALPDDPDYDVSADELNDHSEVYSGLTAGQVLRASGATAADFAAIQDGDIPSTIARDSEVTTAVSDHAAGAAHTGLATETDVRLVLGTPYQDMILAAAPIAHWPLSEASGATAEDVAGSIDGSYNGTLTYGVDGPLPSDDATAVFFDEPAGASMGHVRIGGAAFDAAFDADEGSVIGWGRITDPAFWAQTAESGYIFHARNGADSTHYIVIGRIGVDGANTLSYRRRAGGTGSAIRSVVHASGAITDWFFMALTWSVAANEMKAYFNGVQVGTTQTDITAMNQGFTSDTDNVLGAGSSVQQPWLGAAGQVTPFDRVLTAAEIAAFYAAANPQTGYQARSEKGDASGYASLDGSTKVPIAQIPTGSTGSTVPFGNDARLSDARTPTAHATSHQSGGGDAVKLDDLATPDDNTDLNASATRHGLLLKLDNDAAHVLDGTGAWASRPLDIWIGAVDPRLVQSATATVQNRIYLSAFGVQRPVTVSTVKFEVLTSSGNMDLGIYSAAGTKLASTGSTAVPAAGVGSIALTSSLALVPGVRYWAAIEADNATAAIYFWNSGNFGLLSAISVTTILNSTFPLPASITISTVSTQNARHYGVYFT